MWYIKTTISILIPSCKIFHSKIPFYEKWYFLQKDYNLSKRNKHIDSWKYGFISRFINFSVKVKEEECKNQNDLHLALFVILLFQKLKVKTMLKQKDFYWLVCNGGRGDALFFSPSWCFFVPPFFVNNLWGDSIFGFFFKLREMVLHLVVTSHVKKVLGAWRNWKM